MGDLRYRVVKKQRTRNIKDLVTGDESTIEDLVEGGSSDLTPEDVKTLYESNDDTNAFTDDEKSKLEGVEEGATANETDAFLLNRDNHTGTQDISTVTGLQSALDSKLPSNDSRLSAGAAGTATVRAIGTGATQAAAGNHTHSAASGTANGFMSSAHFTKLEGIAAGANNYTLPEADLSSLGGVLAVTAPTVIISDPPTTAELQAQFTAIITALQQAGIFI